MACLLLGRLNWGVDRDADGHRTYSIKWLVKTDDVNDGPSSILTCPGIPLVGSSWAEGNDSDPFAIALPTMRVSTVTSHEPNDL